MTCDRRVPRADFPAIKDDHDGHPFRPESHLRAGRTTP